MKLTQLEYFCVAARYHNITKAAKELFVTQPSISNAIKALEEEFGVNLFFRNNNKLTLTPEGELFYKSSEELLAHADSVESEFHEIRKKITPIRIGIPPMLGTIYLPELYLSLKENIINLLRDVCTRFPLRYIFMYDQCRMYKNLYLNSDRIVLLSNEFKESYIKLSGIKESSKLTAINNMLSFPYEMNNYQKKKQLLWCGRLLFSQKRPDRILLVWKKLQEQLPDWNLVIVGDGPFSNEMKQLSKKLSLQRVEFAGFANPIKYYKESSIFCLTSNHEGWGLVLTEAMQFGCVPIAFDSFESIHEIIEDGKNGFLVKPFDMDKYADKVLRLADNFKVDYVMNVMNSMERLMPENVVKLWIRLFNSEMKCQL